LDQKSNMKCPHCNTDNGIFYQKTVQISSNEPLGYWYCIYCGWKEYEFEVRHSTKDWSKEKWKEDAKENWEKSKFKRKEIK